MNQVTIGRQDVHQFKKYIKRSDKSGRTYFVQVSQRVDIVATGEHKQIVQRILGEPHTLNYAKLDNHWGWFDVAATDVVSVMYAASND